jgi:hypothetical protein
MRRQSNPLCADFKPQETVKGQEETWAEDAPVSTRITFGQFRTVIMGDLGWNLERDLMCPTNKVGTIDLYLVSHHGSETSGIAGPRLYHASSRCRDERRRIERRRTADIPNPERLARSRRSVAEPLFDCSGGSQQAGAVDRESRAEDLVGKDLRRAADRSRSGYTTIDGEHGSRVRCMFTNLG